MGTHGGPMGWHTGPRTPVDKLTSAIALDSIFGNIKKFMEDQRDRALETDGARGLGAERGERRAGRRAGRQKDRQTKGQMGETECESTRCKCGRENGAVR